MSKFYAILKLEKKLLAFMVKIFLVMAIATVNVKLVKDALQGHLLIKNLVKN